MKESVPDLKWISKDSPPIHLTPNLRNQLDALYLQQRWQTFYHYFPLIFAISESTGTLEFRDNTSTLYIKGTNEAYTPGTHPELKNWDNDRVLIMPRLPEDPTWTFSLYDVNYIYDLKETTQVKNFRDNVARFKKEHSPVFVDNRTSEEAWEVVKQWYRKSKREEFTDFGYTEWLAKNYKVFEDLRARFVVVNDKIVGFSLWGELSKKLGIHLIAKDAGMPYLQDYLRMETYKEMLSQGLLEVNDGSDCGIEGLRIYKLKLRPKWIVPIWSWMKDESQSFSD